VEWRSTSRSIVRGIKIALPTTNKIALPAIKDRPQLYA
jgi:hypothetical protein